MEWSATSATNAYLDTLKLCNDYEPGTNEFISALAAGMRAKLIVEVSPRVSSSTIALAAAARQTGGTFVCIVPEQVLAESKRVIKDSGLNDIVEFATGEPSEQVSNYGNIDFSLVDCKNDEYARLLDLLDVNLDKSVVIANNLVCEKKGLGGHVKGMKSEVDEVRSMKYRIGRLGMEITLIGRSNKIIKRSETLSNVRRVDEKKSRSRWVVRIDKESGEEHIFRVRTHPTK